MKATLKFVTLPSPDTPGCTLILTFDDKRYIFGHIGEGTQRAIVERKFSLKHISTLYLTGRCEWRTIGGIVGQALTLIDQEHARNETEREENLRKELNIKKGDKVGMKKGGSGFQGQKQRRELYFRGPGNLPKMMATTRFFVFRTAMPVNVEEAKEGREWANDHMVVKALKTEPSSTRYVTAVNVDELWEGRINVFGFAGGVGLLTKTSRSLESGATMSLMQRKRRIQTRP